MKLKLLNYFFLLIVPVSGISQQAIPNFSKLVQPKHNLLIQKDFKVIKQNNDTVVRSVSPELFKLNPDEPKAVVITDLNLQPIDSKIEAKGIITTDQTRIFMLPELYFARVLGTNEQISYRILFIDEAPLRYNFETGLFEGIIRFLPVEVDDSPNTNPVKKELSVSEEILLTYPPESIPLTIKEINWPPHEIKINTPDIMDSLEIKIHTISNPAGYVKNLAAEPAIVISSVRTRIQGMGIQTLPVHIFLKGVSKYEPIPVTIETTLGTLDTASLILTSDQPKEIILRSENLGDIYLKVINPNYRCNSIVIKAVFPWLFLLLAILGGMIGGLGKKLISEKKAGINSLILGSIFGLIAAFAYWGLGIVLIGFSIETRGLNEAMVFGLGLIAGYFGLVTLKQ